MTPPALPESVRVLLEQQVHSQDELEILLALHRDPATAWTARAVTASLDISLPDAEQILARLCKRHLLVTRELQPVVWFRYSPANNELDGAVRALAEAYKESPQEILRLMSAQAVERVRSAAAKSFRGTAAGDDD